MENSKKNVISESVWKEFIRILEANKDVLYRLKDEDSSYEN